VRLAHLFPFNGVHQSMADQYNDLARREIEHIRDFVCMHYHCTQRDDTPFWRYCSQMDIPETLQRRIDLFRDGGYLYQAEGELFRVDSWIAVFLGQNIEPSTYHHYARNNDKELADFLAQQRAQVAKVVGELPAHADFVRQYAPANPEVWGSAPRPPI
jgi:tryptophan halogenase